MALLLFQYYSLCLFALTGVWIVFVVLVHLNRLTQTIQKRSFLLLQIQNVGAVITNLLLAVSFWERITNCDFFLWSTFIFFALVSLPALMRAVIYGFRYYLTEMRRDPKHQNPGWVRLLLVPGRGEFLVFKMYLVLLVAHLCLPSIVNIITAANGDPRYGFHNAVACDESTPTYFTPIFVIFSLFYMISGFIIVYYIRKARDVFYIKREFGLYALLLIPLIVLIIVQQVAIPMRTYFPIRMSFAVAANLSCLVSLVYTFYLSEWEKRISRMEAKLNLEEKLSSPMFREEFSLFLCLQLSLENLLFWEEVRHFKTLPEGPEQMQVGLQIFHEYVKHGGPSTVNISGQMARDIALRIAEPSIHPTLFNAAENEVFHMMKFHSYPHFLAYQESKRHSTTYSLNVSAYEGSV